MVSEAARHNLHTALGQTVGEDNAGALMEMLPPFEWHEIATKSDVRSLKEVMVSHFKVIDARFENLERRMDQSDLVHSDNVQQHTLIMARFDDNDRQHEEMFRRLDDNDRQHEEMFRRLDDNDRQHEEMFRRFDAIEHKMDTRFIEFSGEIHRDISRVLLRSTLTNLAMMIALVAVVMTAMRIG